jgi:hypothetical protein
MISTRDELAKAFREARKVRIGGTLYVGNDAEVEPRVRRALAAGQTVTEGGMSSWVDEIQVFDPAKSGSAAYTWSGDQVRVERFLVTKVLKTSAITRRHIGFAWRNFS